MNTGNLLQNTVVPVLPRMLERLTALVPVESAATRQGTPLSFYDYAALVSETGDVRRGVPAPLGAHEFEGGVNFALLSRDSRRVRLELFAQRRAATPSRVIDLDPVRNRTGDIWHVWIQGLQPGQLYAYRVTAAQPQGNPSLQTTLRLDPYATAISRTDEDPQPKCVVTRGDFDWRDDLPPRHPWSRTVIYEMHVRGFTAHPSSNVDSPGTFRAVIEKIPYLRDLGVTTLELLPVQDFAAADCPARDPVNGQPLCNYWGYDAPLAVFAPNGAYCSSGDAGQQVTEFKEMVRRLHLAHLELIVDITFPRLRGAVGPTARQFVIDALRYWVTELHVDGFRLDLAALLGKDSAGRLISNPPLLEEIAEDPVLRYTKLVTVGWNAAGAYEMESFSGRRWAEWNGRYRDDVRRFWRGDAAMAGSFASRVCGSEDLYQQSGKGPEIGVNFVSCHDGLTLNDTVTYRHPHNQANGDDAGHGTPDEYSANYGVEGPAADPGIEAVRRRQIKNLLLTLFVSRGVPMLLGGDEFRRTQSGNSNAWCQDNATSWFDWRLLQHDAETHDFVKRLLSLRREHTVLSREVFYTAADIRWCTPDMNPPEWADPNLRALGCLIRDAGRRPLYLMFNAGDAPMTFRIPFAPPGQQWRLEIDTAADLPAAGAGPLVPGGAIQTLAPRSSAILTGV